MNTETHTNTDVATTRPNLEATSGEEVTATEARNVRWYRPPMDVFESSEAFRLDFDMPGVAAERVELLVEGHTLTVEGLRDDARGWRRQLRLTDGVDADGIEASMESGVLRLVLPKAERARQRRITVRSR